MQHSSSHDHAQRKTRKLRVGDGLPIDRLETVDGGTLIFGKTAGVVHMQFRRFAGCPICDLHLHSFARRHTEIERAGITGVILFHSDEAELRTYAGELPFALVADPDKRLYAQFGVEEGSRALRDPRVWRYMLQGILRSLGRVIGGRQAIPPVSPKGGSLGLPADFLIGPDGTLLACKYGAHAYDQWSVDEVLHLAGARPSFDRH
jgi:peroxiredoxin